MRHVIVGLVLAATGQACSKADNETPGPTQTRVSVILLPEAPPAGDVVTAELYRDPLSAPAAVGTASCDASRCEVVVSPTSGLAGVFTLVLKNGDDQIGQATLVELDASQQELLSYAGHVSRGFYLLHRISDWNYAQYHDFMNGVVGVRHAVAKGAQIPAWAAASVEYEGIAGTTSQRLEALKERIVGGTFQVPPSSQVPDISDGTLVNIGLTVIAKYSGLSWLTSLGALWPSAESAELSQMLSLLGTITTQLTQLEQDGAQALGQLNNLYQTLEANQLQTLDLAFSEENNVVLGPYNQLQAAVQSYDGLSDLATAYAASGSTIKTTLDKLYTDATLSAVWGVANSYGGNGSGTAVTSIVQSFVADIPSQFTAAYGSTWCSSGAVQPTGGGSGCTPSYSYSDTSPSCYQLICGSNVTAYNSAVAQTLAQFLIVFQAAYVFEATAQYLNENAGADYLLAEPNAPSFDQLGSYFGNRAASVGSAFAATTIGATTSNNFLGIAPGGSWADAEDGFYNLQQWGAPSATALQVVQALGASGASTPQIASSQWCQDNTVNMHASDSAAPYLTCGTWDGPGMFGADYSAPNMTVTASESYHSNPIVLNPPSEGWAIGSWDASAGMENLNDVDFSAWYATPATGNNQGSGTTAMRSNFNTSSVGVVIVNQLPIAVVANTIVDDYGSDAQLWVFCPTTPVAGWQPCTVDAGNLVLPSPTATRTASLCLWQGNPTYEYSLSLDGCGGY